MNKGFIKPMRFFQKTLWLVADDPEGSWWCDCRIGIVDAPWHDKETLPADGNGWLWTCFKCKRAFMFAKGARIRSTLEKLAEKETPRLREYMVPGGEIVVQELLATPEDWLQLVRPLADQVREKERYVFFDGKMLPAQHGPVKFKGLFRSHDLPDLPHLSKSLLQETLMNPDYWDVS